METIEAINKRLADIYGIETDSSNPMWRVVWSTDQIEKRLTDYVDGVFRLTPVVIDYLKYAKDENTKDKYILERLVLVPEHQMRELCGIKKSYEPMWVFHDVHGNPLPPKWEVCEIVIDSVYSKQYGPQHLAKYKRTNEDEAREEANRLAGIQAELFGNETDVTDAVAHKEGVFVPSKYEKGVQ